MVKKIILETMTRTTVKHNGTSRSVCQQCDRYFRGREGYVKKAMKIHMKKVHNNNAPAELNIRDMPIPNSVAEIKGDRETLLKTLFFNNINTVPDLLDEGKE